MAEKTADEKLDSISAHIDSLHKRFDAMESERKADKARMDAMDEWRAKSDAAEKERADKARADAECKEKEEKEKADKARRDAEAREKDEKEKADKVRADAVAAVNVDWEKKFDELRKSVTPVSLTQDDKNQRAAAQMRLDSACQAWGKPARPPMNGEALRDYRISILNELKAHSKVYKDSNLETIGDEAAFSNIEALIINDAIQASVSSIVHGAPLRESTKMNSMGHRVTTFAGDPAVTWGPFMGGHTRFGKIVRQPNG
jgi:hypothetical protein